METIIFLVAHLQMLCLQLSISELEFIAIMVITKNAFDLALSPKQLLQSKVLTRWLILLLYLMLDDFTCEVESLIIAVYKMSMQFYLSISLFN